MTIFWKFLILGKPAGNAQIPILSEISSLVIGIYIGTNQKRCTRSRITKAVYSNNLIYFYLGQEDSS